jgi:hypothetical protein
LTDSNAWKKNISDIVGEKNQARVDAAQREQTRKDHVAAEHARAVGILQGQPAEGFREFASYLESQGERVAVRDGWENPGGPWIGVDISDQSGLVMDVRLEARVGGGDMRWFWVYEHRGNRRVSQEQEIESGADGLSKQEVIESLADHYRKASPHRR